MRRVHSELPARRGGNGEPRFTLEPDLSHPSPRINSIPHRRLGTEDDVAIVRKPQAAHFTDPRRLDDEPSSPRLSTIWR
jgi:hypothetical protein